MKHETKIVTGGFVPIVLLVLAYEWIVSGIDKAISGVFLQGIHGELADAIPDMQYLFYARLIKNLIFPRAEWFAWPVMIGELSVGAVFLWLAVQMIRNRLHPFLLKLGVIAGGLSAFMNLNFFFYQGGAYFINASDPFDEGIPLDLILFLIEAAIALLCHRMAAAFRNHPEFENPTRT